MELNDVGRLLASVTRKVKRTASQMVHPLTQLEKWLKEATSNTNWGCSSTILSEIARSMTDYHDYVVVQKCIGECLSERPSKWRKVFKTLVLVEYLLKNGIDRFVDDVKEYIYKVRHLQDFYYTEEGRDRGAGIREKSKYILNLLNDPILLKTERKKARDNRGKYIGINGKTGALSAGCGGAGAGAFGGSSLGNAKSPITSPPSFSSTYSRARSLYDPYCLEEDYSGRGCSRTQSDAASRSGSARIRDGLEEVKSAGILGGGEGFADAPVKLPGPPYYAGIYKTATRTSRATERGGKASPDESILNAAQRLAEEKTGEGVGELQSSDWGAFVAAEDEEKEQGFRTHLPAGDSVGGGNGDGDRDRGSAVIVASSLDNNSNNPFGLGGFGKTSEAQLEIERRRKAMEGDLLLLLDTDSWNKTDKEREIVNRNSG